MSLGEVVCGDLLFGAGSFCLCASNEAAELFLWRVIEALAPP